MSDPSSVHIGFDARCLSVERRALQTGVERYASGLLEAMVRLGCRITVYQQAGTEPILPDLPLTRSLARLAEPALWWGSFGLGLHTLMAPPDVLIVPEQYVPLVRRCRVVSIVHDLAFIRHPSLYQRRLRAKLAVSTRLVVQFADHLVANSVMTKRDLMDIHGVSQERITVIYPGCDFDRFRPRSQAESAERLAATGIDGPFLLAVGSLHPRKNLLLAVKALALVKDLRLVFVGKDSGLARTLIKEARRLGIETRISLLGYVDDELKAHLMAQASALVVPSPYEGFGLPVLEAMACGCPVAISNSGALPEVAGAAGVTFDPRSPQALADAVNEAIQPSRRQQLRLAGLERARAFTWDRTAREFLLVARALHRS